MNPGDRARRLGARGPVVFPLSLGCMGMSATYGPADEGESLATIHAALDAGVTLIDTGDFYGTGRNELLLGRALAGRRDVVLLSVKFGGLRAPGGGARTRAQLAESLGALQIELSPEKVRRLEEAVPASAVAGARYNEQGMRALDSER